MFSTWMVTSKYLMPSTKSKVSNDGLFWVLGTRYSVLLLLAVSLLLISGVAPVFAQDQSQAPPQDSSQNNGKPKQEIPAEQVGPPITSVPIPSLRKIPRKLPLLHLRPLPHEIEGMPDYSIKVNVPLVNVDVMVSLKSNGQFVPGLKKEHFRII